VRFFKDLLYSIYLYEPGCKSILFPTRAYIDPESLFFENLGEASSLYELYNEKIDSGSSNAQYSNRSFSCLDVLEIIKALCISIKHCHDRGIMIANLSFDTIFFTDKNDMSSLKIMDFSKAFLIDHKQDFIDKVNLSGIDSYQINSLEKIVLENRYDDHSDF